MACGHDDDQALPSLQIALVRYQTWAIKTGAKAVTIFEGRDAAGKDGTIKRVVEYLAPRNTRVLSLPKPSDREASQWYFQRYVRHLPAAGEWVLFNRSWYNRAGVEAVMGFCTPREHETFLRDVPALEAMVQAAGIPLVKIWLDISKSEQAERLEKRRNDPVKQLKISDLDAVAQKKWRAYTRVRNDMFIRTHTAAAPWLCVRADHKHTARLNVIRYLLHTLAPPALRAGIDLPDPDILFAFDEAAIHDGRLAP